MICRLEIKGLLAIFNHSAFYVNIIEFVNLPLFAGPIPFSPSSCICIFTVSCHPLLPLSSLHPFFPYFSNLLLSSPPRFLLFHHVPIVSFQRLPVSLSLHLPLSLSLLLPLFPSLPLPLFLSFLPLFLSLSFPLFPSLFSPSLPLPLFFSLPLLLFLSPLLPVFFSLPLPLFFSLSLPLFFSLPVLILSLLPHFFSFHLPLFPSLLLPLFLSLLPLFLSLLPLFLSLPFPLFPSLFLPLFCPNVSDFRLLASAIFVTTAEKLGQRIRWGEITACRGVFWKWVIALCRFFQEFFISDTRYGLGPET